MSETTDADLQALPAPRRPWRRLTLCVMAQGKKVITIEGLARGEQLHPMQAAFVEHDGLQCGYCTPGQIMSAVGMHAEVGDRALTDAEVQQLYALKNGVRELHP